MAHFETTLVNRDDLAVSRHWFGTGQLADYGLLEALAQCGGGPFLGQFDGEAVKGYSHCVTPLSLESEELLG
ncbi:hypothetical protein D3C74_288070 [compost metagenome]